MNIKAQKKTVRLWRATILKHLTKGLLCLLLYQNKRESLRVRKYIEPARLIEDERLNATALGVYVTLLHCSVDGKHCKDLTKKELLKLLGIDYKTLNRYLNKLEKLHYIHVIPTYSYFFNITLQADNGNYVDYKTEPIKSYRDLENLENIDSYSLSELFIRYFDRKLPDEAIENIRELNINERLLKHSLYKSLMNIERFVDYEHLLNYNIKVVKDWESKHIKTTEEADRYIKAHLNGYRFYSDVEIERLKGYGINKQTSYRNRKVLSELEDGESW